MNGVDLDTRASGGRRGRGRAPLEGLPGRRRWPRVPFVEIGTVLTSRAAALLRTARTLSATAGPLARPASDAHVGPEPDLVLDSAAVRVPETGPEPPSTHCPLAPMRV